MSFTPGITWTVSSGSIWLRTSALVTWSAATTATATSTVRSVVARPSRRVDEAHEQIRRRSCSTRIATIGLKSIGPNCSPSRRKIRRNGFVTSRRKSSTALTGREYGSRTPNDSTQDTMIHAKMINE